MAATPRRRCKRLSSSRPCNPSTASKNSRFKPPTSGASKKSPSSGVRVSKNSIQKTVSSVGQNNPVKSMVVLMNAANKSLLLAKQAREMVDKIPG